MAVGGHDAPAALDAGARFRFEPGQQDRPRGNAQFDAQRSRYQADLLAVALDHGERKLAQASGEINVQE